MSSASSMNSRALVWLASRWRSVELLGSTTALTWECEAWLAFPAANSAKLTAMIEQATRAKILRAASITPLKIGR